MPVTIQVLHAPTAAGHWDRCFVLLLTRQSILQKYDSPFFTEFIITQDGRHRRRGAASLGKDKCQVGAISWRDAATHFLDTTQSRLCIFLHINTHNYNYNCSKNVYNATYNAGWQHFTAKKLSLKYNLKYKVHNCKVFKVTIKLILILKFG